MGWAETLTEALASLIGPCGAGARVWAFSTGEGVEGVGEAGALVDSAAPEPALAVKVGGCSVLVVAPVADGAVGAGVAAVFGAFGATAEVVSAAWPARMIDAAVTTCGASGVGPTKTADVDGAGLAGVHNRPSPFPNL